MRVAVIEDILPSGTGVGEYSWRLAEGLQSRGIATSQLYLPTLKVPFGDAVNHLIRLPYYLARQARDFDLFHATKPITGLSFPFFRKPKVVTWHDLVVMLCPDSGANLRVRLLAPMVFRMIALSANLIIAVSTQTKEELVTYLKVPEGKIIVINEGVGERFQPQAKEKRDYYTIGYLGAFIARKRVDFLIRAFHHLRQQHPELRVKLVIWGRKGYEYPRLVKLVNTLQLGEDVEFPGFAPEEKMVEVYNSFDVFVLPSQWEGFGFPIVEAHRCGVPVIIRREAHIPEEVSQCCLKANSEEDMAEKMWTLLTDQNLREATISRALEHSQQFTWERNITQTLEVYERLLQR